MNEINFYKVADEIDNILMSDFNSANKDKLLNIITKNSPAENYFWKKCGSIGPIDWFFHLKVKGYFDPQKAPGQTEPDEKGYFTIPQWNVLPYLERVSQQVNIPDNEKYIDELFATIKAVTNYTDSSGQHIDNYRTWWFFVKILVNIPSEKIPLEIIELIPIWLDTKFDTSLQGADIATKLLPKFLSDAQTLKDIEKAEKIIDFITTVKSFPLSPERTKLLGQEKEFRLVVDDYWLKETFDKHAEVIGKKCTNKVIENLAAKTRYLLKKDKSKVFFDEENKTPYRLTLEEHDSNYLVKLASVKERSSLYLFEDNDEDTIIDEFPLPRCDREEFINKVFEHFKDAETFKQIVPDNLKRKIHNLHRNLYDEGTYKSFYEAPEHPISEPLELLTFILRGILVSKAKNDLKSTKEIIREFFHDEYLYFPKMALFTIAQDTDKYGELFWERLEKRKINFIIDDLYFGDELKNLCKSLKKLKPDQKEKLEEIIEKGPKYYLPEEDPEGYLNRWKQKRYKALDHDPHFKKLYDRYKKITSVDVELEPAIGEIITRWGPGKSHLTKEQILQMPNKELAELLSNAKTEGFWESPTVGGLADMLKEAVKDQPEKFISDLSPSLKTGYLYIYEILWGIRDAWNNKKLIEWGKLLDFVNKYISHNDFWQDKYQMVEDDHWHANHQWVVGEIGELIQDGTKDDSWAFPEEHLTVAQEIIFRILDKLKKEHEDEDEIRDPVTDALNSVFGKTLTALIYLALRIARLGKQKGEDKEVRWSDDLKRRYEGALKGEVVEAYTLFGQYMPNLHYLDKQWVEGKIREFEKIDNDRLWSAFMYGYLFINRLHKDLYLMMKTNYLKALSLPLEGERAEKRLIAHLALGYLDGIEDLTETSLFGKIFKKWKPSQISEIISFFWMQKGYLAKPVTDENKKAKIRVIDFWKFIYDKYQDKVLFDEEDEKILSGLAKLAVFLEKIDEEKFKWLKLCAKYVHIDFNSPFFIESLNQLKNKGEQPISAIYIGKIFLVMLDTFTPDFKQEHIRAIIEYLYEVRDEQTRELASKICNIYGKRGLDFLRDIYEKNK